MPSFKPKTNKKISYNKKNAITLDNKHKEFMNEFNKDEKDKIPQLQEKKKHLKETLQNQEITIENQLEIMDEIKEISLKIKELKNKKKEYFLENSKYIFEYFENKKSISNGNYVNNVNNKTKMITNFFKIKENDNYQELNQNKNNKNIVQKYLSNIDDMFLDVNSFVYQTDICKYCNKGELMPLEDEGVLMCNNCSRNIPYLI